MGKMRHLSSGVAVASLLAASLVTGGAAAQGQPFALNRYDPTPLASDWLRVERPTTPDGFGAVLTLDYAHKPYVLQKVDGAGNVLRTDDIVGSQFYAVPGLSFGFLERVLLSAAVPVLAYQTGSGFGVSSASAPALSSTTLGDVRFGARVRLYGVREGKDAGPFAIAIGAYVWAPTGKQESWASDGKVRAQPSLILEVAPAPVFYATLNVGAMFRPEARSYDTAAGTVVRGDLAFGAKLLDDKLRIGAEFSFQGALVDGSTFSKSGVVDNLFGFTYALGNGFHLSAGGGAGITKAPGVPVARGVLRFGWEQPQEAPPPPPPKKVEIKDRDGDLIDDEQDACPDVKGLPSSDPKQNGCPKKAPTDRDGDGIFDDDDACPDLKGVKQDNPKANGCPSDKDKDGIFDDQDACPEVFGAPSDDPKTNGCPPDKDKDGIPDDKDACPEDPGPANDDPKQNGCPVKAKLAEVKGSKIIILDKVLFATNSDKIVGMKSFEVLDSVAEILKKTTVIKKVQVEGHTDNMGNAKYNKELSQRRAAAVVAYLKSKGVEGSRLEAIGYGQDQPIADNATELGRSKNRRVEFKITDP